MTREFLLIILDDGSSDCGKEEGFVLLSLQSDIDSISDCTTIFGSLYIVLEIDTNGFPGSSPVIFTLPSSLQSINGSLSITVSEDGSPTTTVVFPNLERIGPPNGTHASIGYNLGISTESSNVTTVSFPALTSIGGDFDWDEVNSLVTNVSGFPVLAAIGDVSPGVLSISGAFASLELPALDFVSAGIIIESTNPSFRCPSNITPKLLHSGYCLTCQYLPDNGSELPAQVCYGEATQTVGNPTTSPTATGAGTNSPTETGKASGASTLNRAGNQFY
jgi:hypothetical protein